MHIRFRHNYSVVELSATGMVGNSKILTGNTIPALLKDGESCFKPYGGDVDYRFIGQSPRVKLIGIIAWQDASDVWHDLPSDHYLVGVYLKRCYRILLKEGKPLIFQLSSVPKKQTGEVVELRRFK